MRCKKDTSVNLMIDALRWMNVKQRIMYRTLIVIFQIKNKMLPNYLSSKISYVGDTNTHNLRNATDFRLQKELRDSPLYNGLRMFNELPNYIKMEDDVTVFKRLLSECIKTKFF